MVLTKLVDKRSLEVVRERERCLLKRTMKGHFWPHEPRWESTGDRKDIKERRITILSPSERKIDSERGKETSWNTTTTKGKKNIQIEKKCELRRAVINLCELRTIIFLFLLFVITHGVMTGKTRERIGLRSLITKVKSGN